MPKKTVESLDVAGKRVLIRVDFNVPMDGTSIADDRRIRAAIPTIRSVIERGGRAVLMSHLGRPKGEGFEERLSLAPVASRLSELLGKPVAFPSHDCVDADAAGAVASMGDGEVLLLENLRFNAGEKAGDLGFAAKLAAYGDAYVNDAFGACHRSDASMVGLPTEMGAKPRVVGLLVEKELSFLSGALAEPQRPFVVVLGGAKVSDKIGAIEQLMPKADAILIGGAMAYTFIKALGHNVGTSRVEEDRVQDAHRMIEQAANTGVDLHLPSDHVCSTAFTEDAGDIEVFEDEIKDGYMGLDIGPKTQIKYASVISGAKTIVWNGPMGVFEWAPFRVGTKMVGTAIADATASGATTIVGGGDSAAAVDEFKLGDRMSHVSTGGGASLQMLEGKPFKALELIEDA
ncbi:MAG: phosphoglycerate kinase [Phycisphaerales bacterium JB059]